MLLFESFVNSERCKTMKLKSLYKICLRALLIQKDVKLVTNPAFTKSRLRALLIQKDVKQRPFDNLCTTGLRALLIQKDVKQDILV